MIYLKRGVLHCYLKVHLLVKGILELNRLPLGSYFIGAFWKRLARLADQNELIYSTVLIADLYLIFCYSYETRFEFNLELFCLSIWLVVGEGAYLWLGSKKIELAFLLRVLAIEIQHLNLVLSWLLKEILELNGFGDRISDSRFELKSFFLLLRCGGEPELVLELAQLIVDDFQWNYLVS